MGNEIEKTENNSLVNYSTGVQEIREQVNLIQELMSDLMIRGEHYGKITGCEKEILFKSGAEKICMMFRLAPEYHIERRDLTGDHVEYIITCKLRNIRTNEQWGEGVGSCSTMEKKYRWRDEQRGCPQCGGKLRKDKSLQNGLQSGWYCWIKQGGCGWTGEISNIKSEKIENPDIADTWNTVLKIAKKRALVDATLTATACSDIFTQDLDPQKNNDERVKTGVAPKKSGPEPQKTGHPTLENFKKWYLKHAGIELNETLEIVQSILNPPMTPEQIFDTFNLQKFDIEKVHIELLKLLETKVPA